jgi:hypothetical protein
LLLPCVEHPPALGLGLVHLHLVDVPCSSS